MLWSFREVQSNAEIIAAVLDGEKSLYAELVRRHQKMALTTAWRVLGDFHAAEDAVQETFVNAFHNLAGLKDRASFSGWIIVIARREALRLARQRRKVLSEDELSESNIQHASGPNEEMKQLLDTVENLPDHEHVVVVMHYLENHSVQTIAAMTGRPLGTVTKQLSRAVQRLRRTFSEITP
jgi:RNA polymerase sigma-70 factor, ECF subfamily